ncbi:MAG: hypothetical protein HN731_11720 [Rhodospirillaceae bacterium]|nr:hypothetical protein [Rhodospirillaceae bacterium]
MFTKSVFVLLALMAFLIMASPVQADSIDGTWCHKGQRVKIEGPLIVTPSGKRVEGEYDCHSFVYTIPAGEPNAGEKGDFTVQHDTLAHFTRSGSSQFEEWEPCPAPTS